SARAPIIVQFTRVMRAYAHPAMLTAMVQAAEHIYPEVVFGVHLDHGDEASCTDAIESGHYHSVMIDASHLPFSENVAATRRVVERAHAAGLAVEAELGQLKGIEDGMPAAIQEAILTDPAKAEEVVASSGCDSLAVAIPLGVTKVNLGTDGRLIWTRVHREFFRAQPAEFDFMHPGRTYMDEFAAFVARKCELLGSAKRAPAVADVRMERK